MKNILLTIAAVLFCCLPAGAQTRINPTSQVNWSQTTGVGAPTAPCTSANYAQPYTDISATPNVLYQCGTTGWFVPTGGGASPAGNLGQPQLYNSPTSFTSNPYQVYASALTGSDAGAKINNADAQLVAVTGEIFLTPAAGTSIGTNVSLSANHKLTVSGGTTGSPYVVATGITVTLAQGAGISGSGQGCIFSITTLKAGGTFKSTASHVTINGCTFTSADMATAGSLAAIATSGDYFSASNLVGIGPGAGPRAGTGWSYSNESAFIQANGSHQTYENVEAYAWQVGLSPCSGVSNCLGQPNTYVYDVKGSNLRLHDNGYAGLNADLNVVQWQGTNNSYYCNGSAGGTSVFPGTSVPVICAVSTFNGIDGYGAIWHGAFVEEANSIVWGNYNNGFDTHGGTTSITLTGDNCAIVGLEQGGGNGHCFSLFGSQGVVINVIGGNIVGTPGFITNAAIVAGGAAGDFTDSIQIQGVNISHADFNAGPIFIRPAGSTSSYTPPSLISVHGNHFADIKIASNQADIEVEPSTVNLLHMAKQVNIYDNWAHDTGALVEVQTAQNFTAYHNFLSYDAANRNSYHGDVIIRFNTVGLFGHVYLSQNYCDNTCTVYNTTNGIGAFDSWEVGYTIPLSTLVSGNNAQIVTASGTSGTITSGLTAGALTAGTATFTLSGCTLGSCSIVQGQHITIAGATFGGATSVQITDYNPLTFVVTLAVAPDANVASGAAVGYQAPTFQLTGSSASGGVASMNGLTGALSINGNCTVTPSGTTITLSCPGKTATGNMSFDIPSANFALSTLIGQVYYVTTTTTITALTATLNGTIVCSVAPVVTINDLGTSPNTAYGSAAVINSLTTGTADGGFSVTGLTNNIAAGHYIRVGMNAGTCTTAPNIFVTAQLN